MADLSHEQSLEQQIDAWRDHLRRRRSVSAEDLERLERSLRGEFAGLVRLGLAADEAFLVAVKRVGRTSPPAEEFARARADQLLKPGYTSAASGWGEWMRQDGIRVLCLAVLAAAAVKAPALFGVSLQQHPDFYARNASLAVLPCAVAFFAWKRRTAPRTLGWLIAAFVAAAVFANLPGFGAAEAYASLTALHVPIALWLAVGIAHAGGQWSQTNGRMNFVRFSGELFIYYVLIALGGGVLCAFMALTFKSIGINVGPFFESWLLPCGAAGAVVVAAGLVEAKQGVMESLAPMLTRLFTPLFAAMLIAFLVALVWSGRGIAIERHHLIGFDLLLVVVLGLLVYSISARDPAAGPGLFDWVQVALLFGALAADAVALWAIGARIGEFGFSPNRVAALGENLILLVNLAWSAVLYLRFLLHRGSFANLERWQTSYLPVYAVWAGFVVVAFPPLFRWLG
ncbi:MAG: hypothetical protein HZC55_15425 [Verrucomicrobia bacterium]|nr:hypothetical protein [Verrucomicrobiota bacterium]